MSLDEVVHVDVVEELTAELTASLVEALSKRPPLVYCPGDEKVLAELIHRVTGNLFTEEPSVVLLPWPLQVVPEGIGWRADRRRRRARRRLMRALERGVDLSRKVRFRFEATLRGAIEGTEITGTVLT